VTFDQWDVVVVPFPFTDRATGRRRPALVVSRPQPLGNVARQRVLAMITSAKHRAWPLDVPVNDLAAAGLPSASVVRMKLFTLDDRLIEKRVGSLEPSEIDSVRASLQQLFGDLGRQLASA
jgi:mRNA interferase MazF